MIKQIQLRGISHRPSDRMTADGGLEECIDLRLEEQEQAAATPPDDVTNTLAPGLSTSGIDVLFIHKTNTYTNYVGTNNYGVAAYVYKPSLQAWQVVQIYPVRQRVVSASNIGDILVYVLEDGEVGYARFSNYGYQYLGNAVPKPEVTFTPSNYSVDDIWYNFDLTPYSDVSYIAAHGGTALAMWQAIQQGAQINNNADCINFLAGVRDDMWTHANERRRLLREERVFTSPLLLRYAVKLYDGSYVNISEPIMIFGGDTNKFVTDIRANFARVESAVLGTYYQFTYLLSFLHHFKCKVEILRGTSFDWSDFIESVDVFASTDINCPSVGSDLGDATQESTRFDNVGNAMFYDQDDIKVSFANQPDIQEDFLEKMLEKANFYKIASFPWDSLPEEDYLQPYSQDELVVRPRLSENDPHTILPNGRIRAYNNRIMSFAQIVRLTNGHKEPQAVGMTQTGTEESVTMVYYVRGTNGEAKIVKRYMGDFYPSEIRGYVSYADSKCYMAEMYYGDEVHGYTLKVVLPMKPHPRLNCAYGFWGLDKQLDTPGTDDGRSTESNPDIPTEDNSYPVFNRLLMSEMDNPFVFPLGQRLKFSSDILDALPVTTALSSGQFGQFPIYVFTREGVFTVSLNDEGGPAAAHPLSRDVALEGTVAQLDQAIVFVSSQGVMMLSGSSIAPLSPYMSGHRFTISGLVPEGSDLRAALESDGWWPLVSLSLDTQDFQKFIVGCSPCYDYANKRILLFKSGKDYAYDYALDSQTWHKTSLPGVFTRVLNGYPNALVLFGNSIYDWSVHPNYSGTTARKGMILTRPFDLGEPDIRKTIKDFRVRGSFNHPDVKCILLGSMNGHDWKRRTSLRGGSYKSFRLLLLTSLTPGERISWVDVDYDTRFANKLR